MAGFPPPTGPSSPAEPTALVDAQRSPRGFERFPLWAKIVTPAIAVFAVAGVAGVISGSPSSSGAPLAVEAATTSTVTAAPTVPPTAVTTVPATAAQTIPATAPTVPPTAAPTVPPSAAPTVPPTAAPTVPPSAAPTVRPTAAPTVPPSAAPTVPPTAAPQNDCDPNYTPCVPIDSDVDCASGSGNGPSYVRGPVQVIGVDIYGLDGNDNDGIGCENG